MVVNTANLVTQVQNRIDNLVGTETIEQLVILRKAAGDLGLNVTALDAAVEAKITALSGSSTDVDLLLSNKAAGLLPTEPPAVSVIKSIQRGTSAAGTVTISAVNLEKSFVSVSGSWFNTFGGGGQTSQAVSIRAKLNTSTQLVITGNGTADWEVIEYV